MRRTNLPPLANAGPIPRAVCSLALGLLLSVHLSGQPGAGGWRGQLLAKAQPVWSSQTNAEETSTLVKNAISTIDGLVRTGNGPENDLADSLAMELYAFDASAKLNEGLPAQAVIALREAIARARKVPALADRKRYLIDALVQAQKTAGDKEAAKRTYIEAVIEAEAQKDTAALRATLLQQSFLSYELGDQKGAIQIRERILAIDERGNDPQDLINSEVGLGRLYQQIGSEKAFGHARRAYELALKAGLDRSMLDACDLLVRSYLSTDDQEQCKEILDQALAKARERNPADLARFHDRYGRFYLRDDKPAEALNQFEAGLKVLDYELPKEGENATTTKNSRSLVELLLDVGQYHRDQGDVELALRYLAECELMVQASPGAEVSPWADLGEIHLLKGQTAKAEAFGVRALDFAEEKKDRELERKATSLLHRVYKQQDNMRDALDMHERLMAATVSPDGQDYRLGLQRSQMDFEHESEVTRIKVDEAIKQEQLEAAKERQTQRMWYLFFGGILLFVAGGVVAYIDRKSRMARFDREAAQLETQALRSQMNPHFIFNALNSINAFVQKNEPDKAASFLSRFARLMRLVLENSRQSEVPLKDDLEALDAYLHLERARSGEKFDYRIEVAADIDPEDVMVPPLVAQPFVENAIWHGMSGKDEKGLITLSVSRKGDQLLFAIEDDGVGRSSPKRMASMGAADPTGTGKKTSLGTAITKARLDLVRQQKGKDAGFIYVDLPQGTRVELTLPFSSAA